MGKEMEKVYIIGPMGIDLRGISKMEREMEKEYIIGMMEKDPWVIISMIKKLDYMLIYLHLDMY